MEIDDIKFEVGAMYENMKGAYKVISIHRDSMVIRWDNGQEITTSVELQKRIIERIAHEEELRQKKEADKAKKSQAKKAQTAASFVGFSEDHFTDISKNISWRNRNSIGNAVSKLIDAKKYGFHSWAMTTRPEVQWMDDDRHKQKQSDLKIGFFAKINDAALHYGAFIQSLKSANDDENTSWTGLMAWLADEENETWLKQMGIEHQLVIQDASGKIFAHDIHIIGEDWIYEEENTTRDIESLAQFFNNLPNGKKIDIRINMIVPKEEAISQGKKIVSQISTLFNSLMPLYES